MRTIRLFQPRELVFGDHCFDDFSGLSTDWPFERIFLIADPHLIPRLSPWLEKLRESGKECQVITDVIAEPTARIFSQIRDEVEEGSYQAVVGMGGGSVMDTAKLLAALSYSGQSVEEVYGIGKVAGRKLFLACVPTTAGTGSEVSPNAVILDEDENLKKGVVSPFLVPDMAYVDPVLTHTVPSNVSASTGIDALTHCLEAYANKYSHPLTDLCALEGIRLISGAISEVCSNGKNARARSDVALGSLYG
jgi:alcohol dehydrogenase class IV